MYILILVSIYSIIAGLLFGLGLFFSSKLSTLQIICESVFWLPLFIYRLFIKDKNNDSNIINF